MNKKIKSRIYWLLTCVLFVMATGCSVVDVDDQIGSGRNMSFRLNMSNANRIDTKSVTGLSVRYLLTDANGTLLNNCESAYHADNTTIVIEPLPVGAYKLFVLAYDKSLEKYGLQVVDKPVSTNEAWFSFVGDGVPFLSEDALYYGCKEFIVSSELIENQTVDLGYILAGVDVDKNISSTYLRNIIQDIQISMPESARFYTSMSVDGAFKGDTGCSGYNSSLKKTNAFYIMPQVNTAPVDVSFVTTTKDHRDAAYKMTNTAPVELRGSTKSLVKLDLSSHPEAKSGMLYITKSYYDEETRPLILQDDEPKSIFYDKTQRSFCINDLLQLTCTDEGALLSKFYSPISIKNVSVWSSDKKYGDKVLLAHYDSIPAFCGASFDFSKELDTYEFLTASNSKLAIKKADVLELIEMGVEIECDDPYWRKVKQIQASWLLSFASYGGDPDAPDGKPVGNWMGMRPVHIREAIAFMINLGYMISTEEFATYLEGFQGQIWGNGGPEDIIDVRVIIPQLTARPGFTMGLVYTGRGVAGLGGGWTLGVSQSTYFNHYTSTRSCSFLFHEIGHCMGYSHSSGMSYGPWAEKIANRYYVNNIGTFPISNSQTLNSKNNPHQY